MANNNELSNQDLIESTSALSDLSSEWNKCILNADLGSLNIRGAFSALTGQGIAVQYVESLENAIKKIEDNAITISSVINKTAAEQDETDRKYAVESSNKTFKSYMSGGGGSGYSGYSGGSGSNGEYSGKENPDINIDPGNETEKHELTDKEEIKLVETFQKLFDGDLYDALFNEDFASKVKEKLLASPNLSKNIKEILFEMDKNEIQVMLRNMYLSGDQTSGFSKMIVTVFDKDLREKDKKTDIFEAAENISKTYSDMADDKDIQSKLKDLYDGVAPIDQVDDNTIHFTRDFIDTFADTARVTPEEVLTSARFENDLSLNVKDLANTFAVLRGAKDAGSKISSNLYSNIIVKSKG